jgi:delta14-sterol reductase
MNKAPNALLEFGGAPGNALLIVLLPLLTYGFFFLVRFNDGALLPGPEADVAGFFAAIQPTWEAAALYLGWFGLQAALQRWAPGPVIEGTELPQGGRLRYPMNGLASLGLTAIVVAGLLGAGIVDPGVLHDQFGALLTVMTLFTFGFSVFLYVWGQRHGQARHVTGNVFRDFFMGTGHNPRLPHDGLLDLKFFCEARPGLILWVLIDLSMAWVQHRTYGEVSLAMGLVCAFQAIYVLDYFYNEPAILTTMDIKHENFGFMLAFGDLVWVPMTYTLQAAWLVHHQRELSPGLAALCVLANVGGLYIFRAVNNQKNSFRLDPSGARIWGRPVEYIETAHGNKLLVSGFWGWSRHFNYVGDLLMAWSWSLPCGFGGLLPYYYPIYFTILLVHRERRDHDLCSRKYGEAWERYCQRVPWRILPGVY